MPILTSLIPVPLLVTSFVRLSLVTIVNLVELVSLPADSLAQ